jgi:hypothetical protein
MKILKSFDTKIDAEELTEAVNKYGEWNVILVKRHWVRLLLPLILVITSVFLEILMLYFIYQHLYGEHKITFWALAIFYTYTTVSWCLYVIIWIVANILWQIKSDKKYIDNLKHAKQKQKGFEKFMKRTLLTFAVHTLVLIFNASVPFIVTHNTGIWSIAIEIWILVLDIVFIIILNRVMYWLIEYEMTFNISTPDWITTYKQNWFFRTDSMNIATSAIKVIQSSKRWLTWALLQYGDLYIYTDWDLCIKDGKHLELSYIPDPKTLAKKLNSLIEAKRVNWDAKTD